jgi:hypothetical protein
LREKDEGRMNKKKKSRCHQNGGPLRTIYKGVYPPYTFTDSFSTKDLKDGDDKAGAL